MRRHVVLGMGVAGRHHARVLSLDRGLELQTLDIAQRDFGEALDVAIESCGAEIVWHVCTPTDTHVGYLELLAERCPGAAVILEKPLGLPGQSSAIRAVSSRIRLVVQSQFTYAEVLGVFLRGVRRMRLKSPIRIRIEFSKRRSDDNGKRFIDRERLALGYEGFHHVAILLRSLGTLLPGRNLAASRILARAETSGIVTDQMFDVRLEHEGLFSARLSSHLNSVRGRRSTLTIESCDGRGGELELEASGWFTGLPRQTHALRYDDRSGRGQAGVFEEDLMQTGVRACIGALRDRGARSSAQSRNLAVALEIEAVLDGLGQLPR